MPTWEQALESLLREVEEEVKSMNTSLLIASPSRALRGYMLYPYRPSSVKNQQRFNFGVVYPRAFQRGAKDGSLDHAERNAWLRALPSQRVWSSAFAFLQLVERSVEKDSAGCLMASIMSFVPFGTPTVDGHTFYSWQEAVGREM